MIQAVVQVANDAASLTPILITAGVSLGVGFIAGAVAISTGFLGRKVEREKLAHERKKFATETREKVKEEWVAVVEAMDVIAAGDMVELAARQIEARKALKALLSISFTMDLAAGTQLEELLHLLQSADEVSLSQALDRWPSVSEAIRLGPAT
jgi:hypothetical protein